MIDPASVDKLAFVHIMKTAGSYVDRCLREQVLQRHKVRRWRNHVIRNSWQQGLGRDWTDDELRAFLALPHRRVYVHNHSVNWSEDLVRAYADAGYSTFSWVRHPGDALCSFYHWRMRKGPPLEWSLDALLRQTIDAGRPWEIPEWWERLDFVAPFSQEAFERFVQAGFGVAVGGLERTNASDNRGYEHYRTTGEISEEAHLALEASRQMRMFREISERSR